MVDALLSAIGLYFWLVGPPLLLGFFTWLLIELVGYKIIAMVGIRTFILLTFPGVVVHELGHALMCKLTGGTIREMRLFSPQADGTLGYVVCSQDRDRPFLLKAFHGMMVGMGPIFSCSAALMLLVGLIFGSSMLEVLFVPAVDPSKVHGIMGYIDVPFNAMAHVVEVFDKHSTWYKLFLFLYVAFTFSSHLDMSPQDFRVALPGLVVLFVVTVPVGLLLAVVPGGETILAGARWFGTVMLWFAGSTLTLELIFFLPFAFLFWLASRGG